MENSFSCTILILVFLRKFKDEFSFVMVTKRKSVAKFDDGDRETHKTQSDKATARREKKQNEIKQRKRKNLHKNAESNKNSSSHKDPAICNE